MKVSPLIIRILAFSMAALVLAACTMSPPPVPPEAPAPVPPPERMSGSASGDALTAAGYAVADNLAWQMNGQVPPGSRILAVSFVDRDLLDDTSSLGRLLSAHVADRLAQDGHDVVEARLRSALAFRPGKGEFGLTRSLARLMRQKFEAEAVLVGGYTVDQDVVFVSARVVRLDDGVMLAAQDYTMPNRGMVTRLLEDGTMASQKFDSYLFKPRTGASPPPPLTLRTEVPGPERVEQEDILPVPGLGPGQYLLVPPPPGRTDR